MNFINRKSNGQFANKIHRAWNFTKRITLATVALSIVGGCVYGAIFAQSSYAVQKYEAPKVVPADTFDGFYQRKLEEYKKSKSFLDMKDKKMAEIETAYQKAKEEALKNLDKQAQVNILNGIITKIEQTNIK